MFRFLLEETAFIISIIYTIFGGLISIVKVMSKFFLFWYSNHANRKFDILSLRSFDFVKRIFFYLYKYAFKFVASNDLSIIDTFR